VEEAWERPARLELSLDQLNELIEPAFPGQSIAEVEALAAGLANTNLRFRLQGTDATYVLRLHTRDPAAARRELAIMRRLAGSSGPVIPVPPLVYSDPLPQRGAHPYSIWGFVKGTLLQELFHSSAPSALVDMAGACGRVLAAFTVHRFTQCGELDASLQIAREYGRPSDFIPGAVQRALFERRAGARLGAALRDELWRTVQRTAPLLRAIDDRYTLVHGDYKRSNLLLEPVPGGWRVSAVLDWEFAFAGPPLLDVGLFLRAGEALPSGFREAFAAGYRQAGGELPDQWLPLSRLVDILSQVTFLDDTEERPRRFAESIEVVKETVRMLG
jgi:aminoglycoside phosphotransferase (APT) family kinase protein